MYLAGYAMTENPPNMHVIAAQLRHLREDVGDVKTTLSQLTQAITKLALVEERQMHLQEAQTRCFSEITTLNTRVMSIETKLPEHTRVAMWVDRTIWGVLGMVGAYIVKKLQLFT